MIASVAQQALYDLKIDAVGVMLRPTPAGALVTRRMTELDEASQLDNIRARGMVLAFQFVVICADRVRRRDGQLDTLRSGRALLAHLRTCAARGGPTPTRFAFADGPAFGGSVQDLTATRTASWPRAAWDVAVTVYQPEPVA